MTEPALVNLNEKSTANSLDNTMASELENEINDEIELSSVNTKTMKSEDNEKEAHKDEEAEAGRRQSNEQAIKAAEPSFESRKEQVHDQITTDQNTEPTAPEEGSLINNSATVKTTFTTEFESNDNQTKSVENSNDTLQLTIKTTETSTDLTFFKDEEHKLFPISTTIEGLADTLTRTNELQSNFGNEEEHGATDNIVVHSVTTIKIVVTPTEPIDNDAAGIELSSTGISVLQPSPEIISSVNFTTLNNEESLQETTPLVEGSSLHISNAKNEMFTGVTASSSTRALEDTTDRQEINSTGATVSLEGITEQTLPISFSSTTVPDSLEIITNIPVTVSLTEPIDKDYFDQKVRHKLHTN
jgi:hypothetical protein